MSNKGIYSVGKDIVEQICQNSKTECFVGIRGLSKKTKTKQKKKVKCLNYYKFYYNISIRLISNYGKWKFECAWLVDFYHLI